MFRICETEQLLPWELEKVSTPFFNFNFVAYKILVPGPGIKPVPPALEWQSPNHWTTREFPPFPFKLKLSEPSAQPGPD